LINLKEAVGDRVPGTLDLQSLVRYSKGLSKSDAKTMLLGKREMKKSFKT